MATFGHDEVFKPMRQLVDAMKQITALRLEGRLVEALDAVRTTSQGIFGPIRFTMDQVDSESAAKLLGSRERIDAAAELFAEEGEIHYLRDENGRARACHRRALEFYLEGVLLDETTPDVTFATIGALRRKADEWRLSARYQKVLSRLAQ
jgi:hypothetical protein